MKFSICIPNYNYGRYLGDTIRSVLAQTHQDFEIIVADNASTDDSVSVVEAFREPRITLIRNKYNIGFAPNLDRATATAKNDFMILLSSDDLMYPEALATYSRVLTDLGDKAQDAVLTSAVDVINSQGNRTEVAYQKGAPWLHVSLTPADAEKIDWAKLPLKSNSGHDVLRECLRTKEAPANFLATCYSRKLYDQVEGYHALYRVFPDIYFLYKLLSQNPTLIYVPQRLFAYRVHDSNQQAGEMQSGALKYQLDAYMHCVEFPQQVLKALGMKRQDLVDVFIQRSVMNKGMAELAKRQWQRAFKCLALGFATYPGTTLRTWRTYALAGLLALGPLGPAVAQLLYARHITERTGVRPEMR